MALGYAVFDWTGALNALALAGAYNLYSYVYGSEKVTRSQHARPADPAKPKHAKLIEMAHRLADTAGLPRPAVYVTDAEQPNAFSVGRDPQHAVLAFSAGILRALTDNELEGVIGHELAHIKSRDCLTMTLAASIAGAIVGMGGAITLLGLFIRGKGGSLGMILFGLATAIAAFFVQLVIGRGLEYEADKTGAEICQHPEWLASALRKFGRASDIVNEPALLRPATAHLFFVCPLPPVWLVRAFSTHPPIEKRIVRLEAMMEKIP